jgi:hypothetical protein
MLRDRLSNRFLSVAFALKSKAQRRSAAYVRCFEFRLRECCDRFALVAISPQRTIMAGACSYINFDTIINHNSESRNSVLSFCGEGRPTKSISQSPINRRIRNYVRQRLRGVRGPDIWMDVAKSSYQGLRASTTISGWRRWSQKKTSQRTNTPNGFTSQNTNPTTRARSHS